MKINANRIPSQQANMNTKNNLYSPHSYYPYGSSTMSPYHIRSNMERSPPLVLSDAHRDQTMEWRYPQVQMTASSTAAKGEKKVKFKPTVTVRKYSRADDGMTEEEKSKLYYSKRELDIFDLELKAIYILSEELPRVRNSGTLLDVDCDSVIGDGSDEDDDEADSLRGAEMLLFPRRRRNRLLARKSLLKYQALLDAKPGMENERRRAALATASAKLSRWSKLVAAETARRDAVRAHGGDGGAPVAPAEILSGAFCERRRRRRLGPERATSDADGSSGQSKRRKTEQS